MITYSNNYALKIYEIISPIVGDILAHGALTSQCRKLNIAPEQIEHEHLGDLGNGFKSALVIFVGSEGAKIISQQIEML
jgi:hypothetical protein